VLSAEMVCFWLHVVARMCFSLWCLCCAAHHMLLYHGVLARMVPCYLLVVAC
jgi:hypothetical protein